MERKQGHLIVIEGLDGSGKSRQCKLLREYLESRDYPSIFLKEPSKESEYGKRLIKSIREGIEHSVEEEYDLFIKDRKWDVSTNIEPGLKEGKLVVLDRYYYSTIAYQGARGLSKEKIESENARMFPKPDILFYLDVSVEECIKRIEGRIRGKTYFEDKEYLEKVQRIFEGMSYEYMHKIDGSMSEKEVFIELVEELEERVLVFYE